LKTRPFTLIRATATFSLREKEWGVTSATWGGTSSTSSQINFEMGQGGTCPSRVKRLAKRGRNQYRSLSKRERVGERESV